MTTYSNLLKTELQEECEKKAIPFTSRDTVSPFPYVWRSQRLTFFSLLEISSHTLVGNE
jgi:hypothetical protein